VLLDAYLEDLAHSAQASPHTLRAYRGDLTALLAFAEEQGIDFAESWFYSDSITDMPMLERVGHPVAVNPDPRLRLEAKRRNWPILDAGARTHIRRNAA